MAKRPKGALDLHGFLLAIAAGKGAAVPLYHVGGPSARAHYRWQETRNYSWPVEIEVFEITPDYSTLHVGETSLNDAHLGEPQTHNIHYVFANKADADAYYRKVTS